MNRYFILICAALVALLVATAGIAQADFIVDGQTYNDVFHDDFDGTGISVASDNPGGAWNTGTGLDPNKWEWQVSTTSPTVTLTRNNTSIAYFHSNDLEADNVQAYTEPDAFAGLAGAPQWAYEVVFELQTGGDLRDNGRVIYLLWGWTDINFGLNDGATGDTFDIDWCLDRADANATLIFDELDRGTKYTLQARHNADHTIDTFLFETDTPANSWSDMGRTALTETPAGGLIFGDGSNRVAANLDLESVSVGYIPEPSTLTLLTCGLIGLLCYAWRKRK